MPEELKALATELGIENLEPQEQEAIAAGFSEVALKAATAAVLEKLSAEKQEAFADLAEAGDANALKAFLDREVPGHETLAGEAVRREFAQLKAAIAS